MTLVAHHFEAKFPDRLRLPFRFDPQRLAADLRSLASVSWTRHYVKQNYDGDWSVIPLRSPAGERHPVRMINSDPSAKAFENTPFLEPCPYFRAVMERFRAPLRNVRLMRLTPGSVIKEHTDVDLSFEDGMVRFHIPVVTNPEVDFRLNGERVELDAGSCWYLRLSDPHSVANRGTQDRVHMVLDAHVNDWIEEVLNLAASRLN
jgi:hypothetical protein